MGIIRKYGFNSIKKITVGKTEQEQLDISGSGHLFTFPHLPEFICRVGVELPGVCCGSRRSIQFYKILHSEL